MALPWRDAAALLIVVGAAVASLVAWSHGTVTLGMRLAEAGGQVVVADVTPDGHAAWNGWIPGTRVIDLTTVDAADIERGESIPVDPEAIGWSRASTWNPLELLFGSVGGPLVSAGPDLRPPMEAVEPARIRTAVAGEIYGEGDVAEVSIFATIDRTALELELRSSIWLLAFGVGLGIAVWRLLAHGVAGPIGRRQATLVGCAAAAPFAVLPVVAVGTTAGIVAGYLVPAAVAFVLGVSLAGLHPERTWAHTGAGAAAFAAGLAVVLLVRYMTAPTLGLADRNGILLMIAAIALVPAGIAAMADGRTGRERLGLVSIGLVPGAAQTVIGPRPDALLPAALVGILLGWQLLPMERVVPAIGRRLAGRRAVQPAASSTAVGGITPQARDGMALAILGAMSLIAILAGSETWFVVVALGLAGLVWLAVRRGFLGPAWTDAAVPLAVTAGTPVTLWAFGSLHASDTSAWAVTPTALAGLAVAHLLAGRYPDARAARTLLQVSAGVVALTWILAATNGAAGLVTVGAVALVPGIPLALAQTPDDVSGVSRRLETMAVALTPAAAAMLLVPVVGIVVFGAWVAALVIWKYATVAPLLRIARRTQMQRDLAVAAAETERARLAADLHDDALQQLTMLVRTLDERGDTETADEAREIAAKLRAVVGDLRLPILDDLGAGAALEWLVERVKPLAGGPVRLERSDATRPPASVELAVFRVAQEAITNAIKHGRPPIAIRYDVRADGRVTLAIDDAGEGIGAAATEEAPREGHFGLVNMQQRAEQIGALLDVRRWPGGGTRVALEWRPQ